MANKRYDKEEGVWRTIGGRRVFIKTGQSLSDAMKDSGKFKNKNEEKRNIKTITQEEYDKLPKDYKGTLKELVDTAEFRGENKDDLIKFYEKQGFNIEEDKTILENENGGTILRPVKIDKANDFEEKYSHAFPFHKQTEKEKQYAKDVAEYFKGKDIKEEVKKAKEEFIKSQKTGKDYLPKTTKIEVAGTSNRKEVSDNIQAHILEYYDNPVDFMEQMDAFDWLPTRWHAGQEIAKGGGYLIYNDDMAEFLNSLNINPKGKSFSSDKSFDIYTSLVGRESERLYNRLEKLYEQYKKEHKGANVSLEDFRKWFK